MEICYYRDPKLNFGDDLNELVWPKILPQRLQEAEDVVIVGIGSILNEYMLGKYAGSNKRLIIVGSGTSYGVPPKHLASMNVLAVRGPFTAAVIGQPHTAVTDSAILLAALEIPATAVRRPEKILFMPHHRSLLSTPWEDIAAECGLTYVSPQQPVEKVLEQFSRARLVVTEAMHGAIVADTLRIPWIPVAISPAVEEFKWRDWTLSMQLPFKPQKLPAGTYSDLLRFQRMENALRDAGIRGYSNIEVNADEKSLQHYLDRRFSPSLVDLSGLRPRRAVRLLGKALTIADAIPRQAAVKALSKAIKGEQFLSTDAIFQSRLDEMREIVRRTEAFA